MNLDAADSQQRRSQSESDHDLQGLLLSQQPRSNLNRKQTIVRAPAKRGTFKRLEQFAFNFASDLVVQDTQNQDDIQNRAEYEQQAIRMSQSPDSSDKQIPAQGVQNQGTQEIGDQEIDPILLAELALQKQVMGKPDGASHKYRKFLCCVTGPAGSSKKFIGISIFNAGLVVGVYCLVFLDPAYPNNFVYGYVMTGLTLAVQLSMFYVACKDPGYINPTTHSSSQVRRLTRLGNESQQEVQDLETHFFKSHIYLPRYCDTCRIMRPPLASHCNFCNACVIQFDHHCTVVNACVGVRNHTAFVLYILLTFLQFVYLTCFTLWEIIWQDMVYQRIDDVYWPEEKEEIILDATIILLITIKVIIKLCFSNRISFGALVLWLVLELVIVQALCFINIKNGYLNVAGLLLCIGTSGAFAVWGILRKQMQLACLGLTLKEQVSRIRQAGIQYDHDPREDIGCASKCSNFWTFWFLKKVPDSQI